MNVQENTVTAKPVNTGIELTWSGVGAMRITKNGVDVYEGEDGRFVDQTLNAGEHVAYRLHGETDDVVKVYTAAVAVEDPLYWNRQFVSMIVTLHATMLQWEPIPDVDHYAVYRQGRRIAEVVGHGYRDDAPLSEPTLYEVRAHRPVKRDHKPGTTLIHAIGNVMALAKELKTDTRRDQELYVMYFFVTPEPKEEERTQQIQLRVQTFIRPPMIKNPNLLSPHPYFEGDHRPFNVHAEEYRTRTEVEVEELQHVPVLSLKKDANVTRGYTKHHKLTGEDVASVDDVFLEDVHLARGEAGFRLQHAVGNPLVVAPDIKYTITSHVKNNRAFKLAGSHTQSPHHEIYMKIGDAPWQTIHRADDLGVSFMGNPMPECHWTYLMCTD